MNILYFTQYEYEHFLRRKITSKLKFRWAQYIWVGWTEILSFALVGQNSSLLFSLRPTI